MVATVPSRHPNKKNMSLSQKTKRYKNYFFTIDLDPSHDVYDSLMQHAPFDMLPAGEYAMYTSKSYGFFSEAADELREVLNVALNKLAKSTGTSVKIVWEQNDGKGSEALHTCMQWAPSEISRYYAVVDQAQVEEDEDDDEDDDGEGVPYSLPTNWFIRVRLMYADEGVIVLDAPKSRN